MYAWIGQDSVIETLCPLYNYVQIGQKFKRMKKNKPCCKPLNRNIFSSRKQHFLKERTKFFHCKKTSLMPRGQQPVKTKEIGQDKLGQCTFQTGGREDNPALERTSMGNARFRQEVEKTTLLWTRQAWAMHCSDRRQRRQLCMLWIGQPTF